MAELTEAHRQAYPELEALLKKLSELTFKDLTADGYRDAQAPVSYTHLDVYKRQTAKRARQIIAGEDPMVAASAGKKPLSVAVQELYEGKVKIVGDDMEDEDAEETAARCV